MTKFWKFAVLLTAGLALGSAPLCAFQDAKSDEKKDEDAKPAEEEGEKKDEDRWLALRGADVHTVSGGVLRGATVLVKNKKIAGVGHDLELPKGTEIYDLEGFQVYPGLVSLDSSGLVGSRGKVADTADPFNYTMTLGLSAGITTAKQGKTIVKLTKGELDGMVLRDGVGITLNYAPGFQTREKVRASLSKARRYIREFDAWAVKKATDKKFTEKPPSKAGVDKNMIKLLRGEDRAFVRASDARTISDYADLAQEFEFSLVIQGGTEAWTVADKVGRSGAMVLVTPRASQAPNESTNRKTGSSIENAAILYRTGVPVGILPLSSRISLGGIAGRDLLNLTMEAAFAIRGGLPQEAALEALTIGAARILGVAEHVGTIEAGKDADLIVTDGDLFDYRTFVQLAFVNGKLRYDKSKETFFSHIRPKEIATPTVEEPDQ